MEIQRWIHLKTSGVRNANRVTGSCASGAPADGRSSFLAIFTTVMGSTRRRRTPSLREVKSWVSVPCQSPRGMQGPRAFLAPASARTHLWLRGEKRSQDGLLNLSFVFGKGEAQIGFPSVPEVRGFLLQAAELTLRVTYLPPVHKELQLVRNLGWARHGSGEFGLLAPKPATEVTRWKPEARSPSRDSLGWSRPCFLAF